MKWNSNIDTKHHKMGECKYNEFCFTWPSKVWFYVWTSSKLCWWMIESKNPIKIYCCSFVYTITGNSHFSRQDLRLVSFSIFSLKLSLSRLNLHCSSMNCSYISNPYFVFWLELFDYACMRLSILKHILEHTIKYQPMLKNSKAYLNDKM